MDIDSAPALLDFLSPTTEDGQPRADVRFSGAGGQLPSVFDVTGFAAATVAAATRAVAEFRQAVTGQTPPAVVVDRRAASAAFKSEALFAPKGWTRPAVWDPIAGDYRAADGWIRLHTNYAHHRAAVERVLGSATERADVAAAVARWDRVELETAVVQAGGCAAAMHDRVGWASSPAGRAAAREPWARITRYSTAGQSSRDSGRPDPLRPLAGVRVLDLTRVIAGPIASRFLAGYGAEVLRIDPPGFQEVAALLPITTAGKRCAALDLRESGDRGRFEALVRTADVLISGLRGEALDALGYPVAALRALNPTLIDARLNAYGWSGPWTSRRGFDSLVQMSCGIAAAGGDGEQPHPLPAQALDHGAGYLLATAVIDALSYRLRTGASSTVACSLIGAANVLMSWPTPDGRTGSGADWSASDTEPVTTEWGDARAVPIPGHLVGVPAYLTDPAGSLGRDRAEWADGLERVERVGL
ncbi:MAG: CoA transferase, family protein [Frankiales bacterium]|nr:CoA transferase, family protein [Frankiales bacterium]